MGPDLETWIIYLLAVNFHIEFYLSICNLICVNQASNDIYYKLFLWQIDYTNFCSKTCQIYDVCMLCMFYFWSCASLVKVKSSIPNCTSNPLEYLLCYWFSSMTSEAWTSSKNLIHVKFANLCFLISILENIKRDGWN